MIFHYAGGCLMVCRWVPDDVLAKMCVNYDLLKVLEFSKLPVTRVSCSRCHRQQNKCYPKGVRLSEKLLLTAALCMTFTAVTNLTYVIMGK